MKDKIIDFKTAKLAKEKGFDIRCFAFFSGITGSGSILYENNTVKSIQDSKRTLAPTQNLLQKWLREKHNIHIEIQIDRTTDPKFCYEVYKYSDFGNWENITNRDTWGLTMDYEKNLEDALFESLLSVGKENI